MQRAITIAGQDGIRELSYRVLMHIAQRIRADSRRMYDIKNLIATESPTIVDGGAHKGETIEQFRRVYPNSKIFAFEPIPYLADYLTQNYRNDPLVEIHQMALGAENTDVTLNVREQTRQSSILESATHLTEEETRQITVPQRRLDDILSEHIGLLKLDLQGYELQALQGAVSLLNRTDLILTEVEFIPLYKRQSEFCDIHQFLTENEFGLYNLYSHLLTSGARLEWGNALYIRTAEYPDLH